MWIEKVKRYTKIFLHCVHWLTDPGTQLWEHCACAQTWRYVADQQTSEFSHLKGYRSIHNKHQCSSIHHSGEDTTKAVVEENNAKYSKPSLKIILKGQNRCKISKSKSSLLNMQQSGFCQCYISIYYIIRILFLMHKHVVKVQGFFSLSYNAGLHNEMHVHTV